MQHGRSTSFRIEAEKEEENKKRAMSTTVRPARERPNKTMGDVKSGARQRQDMTADA
jgi:hypothetical protein